MALRKILVGVLTLAMVSTAWAAGQPLGSITSSNGATVRDMKLTPGSTLFMGDVISVETHGGARIALASGAQAEVLGGSSVRLAMADRKIQMVVDRGQASFHTSGSPGMSALVADATVRPADQSETSAVIQSLSDTHAIVAARKGALLVTTAHDGKVYTIPEGEAADLSAGDAPQQGGAPSPAGKSAPGVNPNKKKVVIWTVVIVGAGVAVTAYLLARRETGLSTTALGNEVSPAKLN